MARYKYIHIHIYIYMCVYTYIIWWHLLDTKEEKNSTEEVSRSVGSVAQSCLILCSPINRSTPGLAVHHQLLEFTQTHVHRVGDAFQPSHPLSSPSPPIFNHSSIRVFSNESTLHMRWPKYWSFSFSISPSNEHPGLISFRMDWLDLLAVQGTLKSLLQHHRSKASIFLHSAFFTVQLSHPYMTIGKTIALPRRTAIILRENRNKLQKHLKNIHVPSTMPITTEDIKENSL